MKTIFYRAEELPKDLFKACIIPRPIGWVSTISSIGKPNLAPFSYFNAICDEPPMIMFSTTNAHIEGGPKDSLKNIEEVKEFVINITTFELRDEMNITSVDFPRRENEFEHANLESISSTLVKPLRIKKAPIHLECKYFQSVQLPTNSNKNINRMIIGLVEGIHVSPEILKDGLIDIDKLKPIARLGYNNYITISSSHVFTMIRPLAESFSKK